MDDDADLLRCDLDHIAHYAQLILDSKTLEEAKGYATYIRRDANWRRLERGYECKTKE